MVIGAGFDGQGALSRSGTHLLERDVFADSISQSESGYTSSGQDDGMKISGFEFPESGIDVAPQRNDIQIVTQRMQLRLPAQAAGAHLRSRWKILDSRIVDRKERIAGVFALRHGG